MLQVRLVRHRLRRVEGFEGVKSGSRFCTQAFRQQGRTCLAVPAFSCKGDRHLSSLLGSTSPSSWWRWGVATAPKSHPLSFVPSLQPVQRVSSQRLLVLLASRGRASSTVCGSIRSSCQAASVLLCWTADRAGVRAFPQECRAAAGTRRSVGVAPPWMAMKGDGRSPHALLLAQLLMPVPPAGMSGGCRTVSKH